MGDRVAAVPFGTGIIDLNIYPAPDLVIEVAKSSLFDDLSVKRFLYESLGVKEYWVVDVEKTEITAYVITDGGSKPINVSQVLPGLAFTVLEEALRRSRETDQSQVGAWLLIPNPNRIVTLKLKYFHRLKLYIPCQYFNWGFQGLPLKNIAKNFIGIGFLARGCNPALAC